MLKQALEVAKQRIENGDYPGAARAVLMVYLTLGRMSPDWSDVQLYKVLRFMSEGMETCKERVTQAETFIEAPPEIRQQYVIEAEGFGKLMRSILQGWDEHDEMSKEQSDGGE